MRSLILLISWSFVAVGSILVLLYGGEGVLLCLACDLGVNDAIQCTQVSSIRLLLGLMIAATTAVATTWKWDRGVAFSSVLCFAGLVSWLLYLQLPDHPFRVRDLDRHWLGNVTGVFLSLVGAAGSIWFTRSSIDAITKPSAIV